MRDGRQQLMSTVAAVPLMVGLVLSTGLGVSLNLIPAAMAQAQPNPCGAAKPGSVCTPCNPCAAKKPPTCNPCAAQNTAPCNPCNPCAAKTVPAGNPCTPAAAASPCNPCAASAAATPSNPCAAKVAAVPNQSKECFVPRIRQAALNPTAAKKVPAANPCNPCAATAAASPGNPCAAKKVSTCGADTPPAAGTRCNPCAVKTAGAPCNPCAAANPAAAANPCAAASPGEPAKGVVLTREEAIAAYDCLYDELRQAYANTGIPATRDWKSWATRFSNAPYASAGHSARYVNNYANSTARESYGLYEELRAMPAGAVLIKDSFSVTDNGDLVLGPLFMMEKMNKGFNKATADWRYYMLMPDGGLSGLTKGKNSDSVTFCHECHSAGSQTDFLMLLPEEYRVTGN